VSMWRALRNRDISSGAEALPVASAEATAPRAAEIVASPDTEQASVASGLTAPPTAVRQAVVDVAPAVDAPFVSPLLSGVAGRYRVTQRIRSVDGSTSCESVARALGVGRETDERITHEPGSTAFRLDSRGVAGTLDREGRFVAGPLTGTTNNIPWQFRMRGRFLPNGFSGESETYTQAIIRWGRTQSCVVTADLSAIRLPG